MRVWDSPTRIFHWSLVSTVAFAWTTEANGRAEAHIWAEVSLIALVLFRIAYGFVGSDTARFAHFLKGPRGIANHIKALFSKSDYRPHAGHNPLGGLAIVAMLAVLLAHGILGLMGATPDGIAGPFAGRFAPEAAATFADWHQQSFQLLLWLVGLHISAILLYPLFKGDDLLGPMISGEKENLPADVIPPHFVPARRALLVFGACLGVVGLVLTLA
ncbi:MAG: cytochrome b/b6 domain-containing protein [Pseudomonadota bacterium]